MWNRRAFLLLAAGLGLGIDPAQGGDPAKAEVENVYNVDSLMMQAVDNISARYNLNPEQHEVTKKMMTDQVNRFLREHQDEIYPLIRDMMNAQLNGERLTEAQRKRLGKAGKPLIELARQAILESNTEWRKVLSDEQKALHDWDLQEMEGQFGLIRENFGKMEQGQAVRNPIFPEREPTTKEPARPAKPAVGMAKHVPAPAPTTGPAVERAKEDVFDQSVSNFIRDYELDSDQQEAAWSIGREYKGYADVYRSAHRDDFANAEKSAQEARKAGNIDQAKEAESQLDQLNQRIYGFLTEMKDRLMTIPRETQKAAFEKKQAGSSAESSPRPEQRKTPPKSASSASQPAAPAAPSPGR